jgi:hypothetical protein
MNLNKLKPLILPAVIVSTIFSLYAFLSANPLMAIKRKDSNYYAIKDAVVGCQPARKETKDNKIILRIDDPHAFFLDKIVFRMVDDAIAHSAPVVLGVIPKDIEKDSQLVSYINHNLCNIEIALHGWDHSENPPEFANLTEQEAFERMSRGKWVLENLFNKSVTTFIAPQNEYSEGTIKAASRVGFKIFTSEGEGLNGFNATTYDFGKNKLVPISEIIHQCMDNFADDKPCVIMIHPQDYATKGRLDEVKYQNYLNLIDVLEKLNVSFVTFEELPSK